MNKTVIFLFFGILAFGSIHTQSFSPVLRTDAEWTILHAVDRGFSNPFDTLTEHYRLKGDTMIEDIVWEKIYFSTDTIFDSESPNLQFGGLIREEDGRVYYAGDLIKWHRDGDPIYDFNLKEGEAFWKGTDDTATPLHLIVYDIDTIVLQDDLPRRRYRLRFYYPETNFTDIFDISIWVEGLGDIANGLLHQYLPPDFGPDLRRNDELICYKVNEAIVFESPEFDDCFFERITVGATHSPIQKFNIFPNPGSDHFYLSSASSFTIDQIIIFDQSGKKVFQGSNIPVAREYKIDSTKWPVGIYFIHFDVKGKQHLARLVRIQ